MTLFSLVKKLIAKRALQIGVASVVVISIAIISLALAGVAKEESKVQAGESIEDTHAQEEHEEHEEKVAILTDVQLKTAGIELAQVGPANIREILPLYGTVEANGEKIQRVGAPYAGTVRRVNKSVGDVVLEGEELAKIESNESLKIYSVTSALNGVITERNINPGEQTAERIAFVVMDLSTVWVDVAVFPRDAGKVHIGQLVSVKNPANDISAKGEVVAVAAMGAAGNQSLSARVLLSNAERQWVPGLFVNVDLILAERSVAMAVRNEALQNHEGKQVVFIKGKDGFEPRPVKPGYTDGEFTELLSGVKAGETYAGKNSFIIKAELGKDGAEHGH